MEYNIPEDTPQVLNEDITLTYPSNGIADAIWTLIVNQTAEVQAVIAERLNNLRSKSAVNPYTLEELNSRIDEAEQQMTRGEITPGNEVHSRMRNLINSL